MVRILRLKILSFRTLLVSLLSAMACQETEKKKEYTPWGSVVGEEYFDTLSEETMTVGDILSQGEMIMLTLSGPETYYEYHGHPMGIHYLLCERLAQHIGVKLRVEVCKDTAEMVRRLSEGEADIIACPVKADSLQNCGPQWAVDRENTSLEKVVTEWYRPSMLQEIQKEQKELIASGGVTRRVYAPVINREKGLISRWDNLFRRYAQIPRLDWKLLAAQCYQESCFDPRAHSWAGACGLMQIMPQTADMLGLDRKDLYDPEKNVHAAARYMMQLMKEFDDVPSHHDRICFALASYNGGKFHIRDAMALAEKNGENPRQWNKVGKYVLRLMKPEYYNDPVVRYGYMRGTETFDYVERIMKRWGEYGGKPYRGTLRSGMYDGPSTQPGIDNSHAVPKPARKRHRFSEQETPRGE